MLTFSYGARPAGAGDRFANIRVDWPGGSATRTARQAAAPVPTCSATVSIVGWSVASVPSGAGRYTVSIQAATGGGCGRWIAEPRDGASLVDPTAGGIPGTFTFNVGANPGSDARTVMRIVITSALGDPSGTLEITQAGTR